MGHIADLFTIHHFLWDIYNIIYCCRYLYHRRTKEILESPQNVFNFYVSTVSYNGHTFNVSHSVFALDVSFSSVFSYHQRHFVLNGLSPIHLCEL